MAFAGCCCPGVRLPISDFDINQHFYSVLVFVVVAEDRAGPHPPPPPHLVGVRGVSGFQWWAGTGG